MVKLHLSKELTDASLILLVFLFLCFVVIMTFASFFSTIAPPSYSPGYSSVTRNPSVSHRQNEPDPGDVKLWIDQRVYQDSEATLSFGNTIHCEVACVSGDPCEYQLAADFRIVVLAYDAPDQLAECLASLERIKMYGDAIVVDVWIDRLPGTPGRWNDGALRVASHFLDVWQLGYACIHVQERNVGAKSQWINSWRPQADNSSGITLIVEEDVVLSPYVYRWLRNVWSTYVLNDKFQISGVSLNTDGLHRRTNKGTQWIHGPSTDSLFAYRGLAGGAFAPNPRTWKDFQRWYRNTSSTHHQLEYVIPGQMSPTIEGREDGRRGGTWNSWYAYYCYTHKLYSLCPNLVTFSRLLNVSLAHHVGEEGSTGIRKGVNGSNFLLREWKESYDRLPNKLTYLDYNGMMLLKL